MSEKKTADLVIAAQAGDTTSLNELFIRFQSVVHSIAMKELKNFHNAADLEQEIFLRVARKLHQLRKPAAFPSWIVAVARSMVVNQRIRRCRYVRSEDIQCLQGKEKDPSILVQTNEQREILAKTLAKLKPIDEHVLTQHYLRHKNLKQICDETGRPLSTIKRRLHVARIRLKERILESDLNFELIS
jgi:RNA polymerase sigma-70 factor (ECF subfamily)